MITMEQLSANLDNLARNFGGKGGGGDFPNWLNVNIGASALAMIEKRVRRQGKGAADGSQWKPYSTKPTLITPASFTKKGAVDKVFKELKGKRKSKRFVAKDGGEELQWYTVKGHHLALLPGGYKRIREIEGRQTNFKDFERTGQMWKSIRPAKDGGTAKIETSRVATGFITYAGSDNEQTQKKLQGHLDREGKEILMVTKQEEMDLQEILDKMITNLVNKAFGG